MALNKTSAGKAAREFAERCLEPGAFTEENSERTRDELEALLIPPFFPGTGSCVRFLVEFDVRRVVAKDVEMDVCPTPAILPAEWLKSLGIDPEEKKIGIFDEAFCRDFERRCLSDFTGHDARRHPMVGWYSEDSGADRTAWNELLESWTKEFRTHYGVSKK
ncbi:MAG: hypothetical protein HYS44_01725 [Candidatus Niyogibacteria bacterium]|nr:hypothetical protein [Candidatus Niyogibacteria bacterium]